MPVYKSPSTLIRSVDIFSKPNPETINGVPGLVIGTSRRGTPFVPIRVRDFENFVSLFGNIDSFRFGPLAIKQWLDKRTSGAYIRVLGIGDGKSRIKLGENAGSVNKAGFIVGSQQVQTGSGNLTHNVNAHLGGPPGRTYFLGCFMTEQENSTIFSDAGIQKTSRAMPIIRGVLMAPSGVTLSLNTEKAPSNTPEGRAVGRFGSTDDAGLSYGDILVGSGDQQKFIVILNGFKENGNYKNTITASFDPAAPLNPTPTQALPLREAFNTDPTKIEQAGHYLHMFYDIPIHMAIPTASEVTSHEDTNKESTPMTDGFNGKLYQTAFLLSSSLPRNTGSSTTTSYLGQPNFENFEDRYSSAFSPSIFSQTILGKKYDLFKIHAIDSGEASSLNYKVTINNIQVGPDENLGSTRYPRFDLHVRDVTQPDQEFGAIGEGEASSLETWTDLTLDPGDPKFISKIIGDKHLYYDFDKKTSESQRVVDEGNYYGGSALIRVEVSKAVEEKSVPPNVLPVGFRGVHHLVTSGTTLAGSILSGTAEVAGSSPSLSSDSGIRVEDIKQVVQPPLPMRESLFVLAPAAPLIPADSEKKVVNNLLTWGFQTENKLSLEDPNKIQIFNTSSLSFMQFMPNFHTNYQNVWSGDNSGVSDVGGSILDADRFNNNMFTLERVEVIKDAQDKPDKNQWAHAVYNRKGQEKTELLNEDGILVPSRFLREEDFKDPVNRKYLQFTFPLIGGFDGTNIFDVEKKNLTNTAIIREIQDPNQGGRRGPTVTAYQKTLDILEENKDFEMSVFSIPGIRHETIVDSATELATRRSDVFYIFDLQERDELNKRVTGSFSPTAESLKNTRNSFTSNPKQTTYAAGFFPDVRMEFGTPGTGLFLPDHKVPPTVPLMGRMSRGQDHHRITGPKKGSLGVIKTDVKFFDEDIDNFFQDGINLISGPTLEEGPGAAGESDGPFLRSAFTMATDKRPLSRIPVRRMLLFVRKEVKRVLKIFLFQNMTETLYRTMRGELETLLSGLQQQGVFKFYQLQVPNTLRENQSDVNNNTMRIKILIRPNNATESLIVDMEEAL